VVVYKSVGVFAVQPRSCSCVYVYVYTGMYTYHADAELSWLVGQLTAINCYPLFLDPAIADAHYRYAY
jgi:hypothetical protein